MFKFILKAQRIKLITFKNNWHNKKIILYGCGQLTKMVISLWPKGVPQPQFIVDKYQTLKSLNGIPIIHINELSFINNEDYALLLSAFKLNIYDVIQDLEKHQFEFSGTVYDLLEKFLPSKFSNGWSFDNSNLNINEILKNYNMFADELSKDLFKSNLMWRYNRTIQKSSYDQLIHESQKYINELTIPGIKKADLAIDLGSWDGSFINHFNYYNNKASVLGFEPDPTSFERAQKNIRQLKNATMIRMAISNKKKKELFFSNGGLSSRIVETNTDSNLMVESTTLDELFHNKINSENIALKIHIEGKELEAIQGGKEFIRSKHPLIMINCSHNQNQLMKTPFILEELGYEKIFLRAYSNFGEGLTCYAFD